MVIIRNQYGHILLEQRPPSGIWGGLWSFPQFEIDADIQNEIAKEFSLMLDHIEPAQTLKHTFSHYHLEIHALSAQIANSTQKNKHNHRIAEQNLLWLDQNKPIEVGLPAPIKKLLAKI